MNAPSPFRYFFLVAAFAILNFSGTNADDYRTLKNSAGKEIRAKILAVTGDKISIAVEGGQQFEIPLATL